MSYLHDIQVKLWKLETKSIYLSQPQCKIDFNRPVESVGFNPTVSSIISVAADAALIIYDMTNKKSILGMCLNIFNCWIGVLV